MNYILQVNDEINMQSKPKSYYVFKCSLKQIILKSKIGIFLSSYHPYFISHTISTINLKFRMFVDFINFLDRKHQILYIFYMKIVLSEFLSIIANNWAIQPHNFHMRMTMNYQCILTIMLGIWLICLHFYTTQIYIMTLFLFFY